MLRNNGHTTGDLLDYLYHHIYYKPTGTDLSRQTNTNVSKQISFTGRLEGDDGATMLVITENQRKTILDFLDSFNVFKLHKQCNIKKY